MKRMQIGTSDFKELIKGNNYFADKSLLIKEFIENGAKIILTPRPRRFGKTLKLQKVILIKTRNKIKTTNLGSPD